MVNLCIHGLVAIVGLAVLYGFGVGITLGYVIACHLPDLVPESRRRGIPEVCDEQTTRP